MPVPQRAGLAVDAGHAIGEQQRRLRHADLAVVAVLAANAGPNTDEIRPLARTSSCARSNFGPGSARDEGRGFGAAIGRGVVGAGSIAGVSRGVAVSAAAAGCAAVAPDAVPRSTAPYARKRVASVERCSARKRWWTSAERCRKSPCTAPSCWR